MTDGLTADQVEKIVADTIKSTLESLGIDTTNKINMQADFSRLRVMRSLLDDKEFQADLAFMRKWRKNADSLTETGMKHIVTIFITGLLGLIILGTKEWWMKHIG